MSTARQSRLRSYRETDPLLNMLRYSSAAGIDHEQRVVAKEISKHKDRFPLRKDEKFPHNPAQDRATAELFGFTFGERIDEMFVEATFPAGWKLKSDGGYWSKLLDDKGRERGNMFLKAAHYDYDAFLSFYPRYVLEEIKPENWFQLGRGVKHDRLKKVVGEKWVKCAPDTYVEPGKEQEFRFGYLMGGKGRKAVIFDSYGYDYGSMYPRSGMNAVPIQRRVKVYEELPEAQQPVDIPPTDYETRWVFRDRATGEVLLAATPYVVPNHTVADHYRIEEERKTAALAEIGALIEAAYPDYTDMKHWLGA